MPTEQCPPWAVDRVDDPERHIEAARAFKRAFEMGYQAAMAKVRRRLLPDVADRLAKVRKRDNADA